MRDFAPVYSGEILPEEFLSQYKLAQDIGVPAMRIIAACARLVRVLNIGKRSAVSGDWFNFATTGCLQGKNSVFSAKERRF